jgi:hypothetical protein
MGKPKGATSYRFSENTMATVERLAEKWGVSKAAVLEMGVALLDQMLTSGVKGIAKALAEQAKGKAE